MTQTTAKKETYSAVVESGSCSRDYKVWEERATCGHAHRTEEAAAACLAKKQARYCNHGRKQGTPCARCNGYAQGKETSGLWYNGTIHNQDGQRLTY